LSCSQGGNHTETNLANSSYKMNFLIGEFLPKFDLKTNTFLQKFANKNTLIGTHLSKTQNHS
jgi:hypothetical protein